MANSLTTDLILDTLSKRTLNSLGNVFAPLTAFALDFSDEALVQGQNVRVPAATAGATVQTNPTNWESGDSNIGNINVPVNHYSVSFHITPREVNSGFFLNQLVDINLQNFANKIYDVALAPLTTTNFSNITVAQASIVAANLQTAWASVSKSPIKNVVLDSVAMSKLLPTDKNGFDLGRGAYGFDAFYLNTRWTGAGTNIYGFAGGPNSLAMVAGVPAVDEEVRADLNQTQIAVPLGGRGTNQGTNGPVMTVTASTWISRATRVRWASFDVAFGVAKNDNTAGILFKSA